MQQSRHIPDIDSFFRYYGQDISDLLGPECYYDWSETDCYDKDFVSMTTQWGKCYTFNSGAYGRKFTVTSSGVSSGLTVILDAQTDEYSYGKFSEGFKVVIHGQGQFIDKWKGINVGPGQHVIIALPEKRVTSINKHNQRTRPYKKKQIIDFRYTQPFFTLICRSLFLPRCS